MSVHPTLALLAQLSITRFIEWHQWVGGPTPFNNCGAIIVVPRESAELERSAVDAIRLHNGGLNSFGFRVSPDTIAYLDRRAGLVDVDSSIADLRRAVLQRGGALRSAIVTEVAGDVRGIRVRTRDDSLAAGAVVVAAGAWTSDVLRLVWRAPLWAEVAHVATFRVARPPSLALVDIASGVLIRPWSRDEILVSPRETMHADAARLGAPEARVSRRRAAAALVEGRALELTGQWMGLYDCTTDGLPYVGAVQENIYIAAGFSGGGLKLAPAVGHALAQGVVTGEMPMYLGPLAPDRKLRELVADFGLGLVEAAT